MSPLAFGDLVPCSTCHGVGEIRHKADPAATRERARLRRMGRQAEEPPTFDTCVTCAGAGYVAPAPVVSPPPIWLGRRE